MAARWDFICPILHCHCDCHLSEMVDKLTSCGYVSAKTSISKFHFINGHIKGQICSLLICFNFLIKRNVGGHRGFVQAVLSTESCSRTCFYKYHLTRFIDPNLWLCQKDHVVHVHQSLVLKLAMIKIYIFSLKMNQKPQIGLCDLDISSCVMWKWWRQY